jgi:hypothetical protein
MRPGVATIGRWPMQSRREISCSPRPWPSSLSTGSSSAAAAVRASCTFHFASWRRNWGAAISCKPSSNDCDASTAELHRGFFVRPTIPSTTNITAVVIRLGASTSWVTVDAGFTRPADGNANRPSRWLRARAAVLRWMHAHSLRFHAAAGCAEWAPTAVATHHRPAAMQRLQSTAGGGSHSRSRDRRSCSNLACRPSSSMNRSPARCWARDEQPLTRRPTAAAQLLRLERAPQSQRVHGRKSESHRSSVS